VWIFHFPLDYNFTHRINHLSFGPRVPGLISALDGDIQVTQNSKLQETQRLNYHRYDKIYVMMYVYIAEAIIFDRPFGKIFSTVKG
jgi:hypothetical protein